jgi:hypothetical protein
MTVCVFQDTFPQRYCERLVSAMIEESSCIVLRYDLKRVSPGESDIHFGTHLGMLLRRSGVTIEELHESPHCYYHITIYVEIDHFDNIITTGEYAYGNDWDLQDWMESTYGITVMPVGAEWDSTDTHKFRMLHFLIPGRAKSIHPLDDIRKTCKDYGAFFRYFSRHPFTSQPAVMTLFSTLPPADRVTVLELLSDDLPSPVRYYDKLCMAYLKAGYTERAYATARVALWSGTFQLDQYAGMREKLDYLLANPPITSRTYLDTLIKLRFEKELAMYQQGEYSEFYELLIEFSQKRFLAKF